MDRQLAAGVRHGVRALSFGAMADNYDQWRPGYPEELFDDILVPHPAARVLEVGAGTGKATVALASRAAAVVAVEADEAMAAILRGRTSNLPVEVQVSAFEDCVLDEGSFDVLAAAQSWHWVDPERGPALAARLLKPNGQLCLFVNRPRRLDGAVWDAISHIYATYAPALDRRPQLHGQDDREWSFPPLACFTGWTLRYYDWTTTYDAASYTQMIGTHSDHLQLSESTRALITEGITEAINDAGGHLEYQYRTVLFTARLRQPFSR